MGVRFRGNDENGRGNDGEGAGSQRRKAMRSFMGMDARVTSRFAFLAPKSQIKQPAASAIAFDGFHFRNGAVSAIGAKTKILCVFERNSQKRRAKTLRFQREKIATKNAKSLAAKVAAGKAKALSGQSAQCGDKTPDRQP
ncbi:MAG: hypothetical protein LBO72_04035 [Helicobacteraceae bacterium]|jgi:hypothetical protein|nr:hypothetical protein [Helicobacteraceae bacterium]